MLKSILLLLLTSNLCLSLINYTKVVHSTDPKALCLDGSPPVLYYNEGTIDNKFLIYFVGGGFCSGLTP